LIAARREVELELKKQKTSAEQATAREEKAHAKEKEAMAKVEAMMEQLKKKEKAINESRELLNANVSLFCSLFCSVPPSYEYMSIRMYECMFHLRMPLIVRLICCCCSLSTSTSTSFCV